MKHYIKKTFLYICKYVGFFSAFRYFNRKKLLVLTYHGVVDKFPGNSGDFEYRNFVSVDQFKSQISFLKKNYYAIQPGFNNFYDIFLGTWPYTFLITFDDGFRNNYERAFPVLKQKQVLAIFFITTGLISKKEMLWTEKITYSIFKTKKDSVVLNLDCPTSFSISTIRQKETASQKIGSYLKRSSKNKIVKVLKELTEQLNDIYFEDASPERYQFLNWREVIKMSESGMIIGSHTLSHMLLSCLTENEANDELKKSKQIIEQTLNAPCVFFSYPNGTVEDFNSNHKSILNKLGYRCAFSQISGLSKVNPCMDKYEIKRINISKEMDLITFEAYICGLLPAIKKMFKKLNFSH